MMLANFLPTGSLEALGILLGIFAVGLDRKTAGEVAWVAVGGTREGDSNHGTMGIVDEDGADWQQTRSWSTHSYWTMLSNQSCRSQSD